MLVCHPCLPSQSNRKSCRLSTLIWVGRPHQVALFLGKNELTPSSHAHWQGAPSSKLLLSQEWGIFVLTLGSIGSISIWAFFFGRDSCGNFLHMRHSRASVSVHTAQTPENSSHSSHSPPTIFERCFFAKSSDWKNSIAIFLFSRGGNYDIKRMC